MFSIEGMFECKEAARPPRGDVQEAAEATGVDWRLSRDQVSDRKLGMLVKRPRARPWLPPSPA